MYTTIKTMKLPSPLHTVNIHMADHYLEASITRAVYLPVTTLQILQPTLKIKDVHAFDTGDYDIWTRYYREQDGLQVRLLSGISYHLEHKNRTYDLVEFLNQRNAKNQTPELWLTPLLDAGEPFHQVSFYETLEKVLTAIYLGDHKAAPNLAGLDGLFTN